MKKRGLCLLLIIFMTTTGCSSKASQLFSKSDKDHVTLTGDIQNTIVSVSSTVSGKIIEMPKEQGEPVQKGDIIAVIDHTIQTYSVDQLQAIVQMKEAKLEELKAGTRPLQIEQAKAQVRAIEAKLEGLIAGTRPQQIEQAKNGVSIAQEGLAS